MSNQQDAVGILNEEVMKKNILTATLITLGLTAPTAAFAFSDADENLLITASRTQQDQFLMLSAAKIITAEDIAVIQPQNVTDLLSSVAGVTVTNNGGAGQASSVFTRGTNSDHTLILVDGVRVGSATLGSTNFAAISPAQIDRIEIVKGPRAALWGSDAFGGVIQIFTKKLTSGEGSITAGFGSNGLKKASASVGLGNNKHSVTLTIAGEDADGFDAYQPLSNNTDTDDDGYDRTTLSIQGKSTINDNLLLTLASNWNEGGADTDSNFGGSGHENEFENYNVNLGAEYSIDKFIGSINLSKSQDEGQTFGNGTPKNSQFIQTQRNQLSVLTQYNHSDNTSFTAGLDSYVEKVSGKAYDLTERDVNGAYIQVHHKHNSFLFEGAVRHDDVETVGSETSYNVSAGYQFSDSWLASVNKSTGFKAPTFNDLYWPGAGNPDLEPETIDNIELLVRGKGENSQLEISIFDSEVENLIDWAPNSNGVWQPFNIDNAEITGVELTWALSSESLSHQLALTYIEAEDANTGLALKRRPKVTANYTLGYHIDEFSINGIISYRDESADNSSVRPLLDDYWLFNTSVTYQATNNISVVGKINNVFDEEYNTAAFYIADGRNYQLSATYTF